MTSKILILMCVFIKFSQCTMIDCNINAINANFKNGIINISDFNQNKNRIQIYINGTHQVTQYLEDQKFEIKNCINVTISVKTLRHLYYSGISLKNIT